MPPLNTENYFKKTYNNYKTTRTTKNKKNIIKIYFEPKKLI